MRSFFDTNIPVYLYDADAEQKEDIACKLFETEASSGRAILSTQVLQELYVVVTRKLTIPLDMETAEDVVRNLAVLPIIRIDTEKIIAAIGRSRRMNLSFWDSLIVEAALTGSAKRLFSEDLQHYQVIDGLRIQNPFV